MSIIQNKEILSELNQCRSNPRRYSSKLVSLLQYYKGNTLTRPDKDPIETQEGIKNVESCIKYLKTVRPSPPLKWSNSLMDVAKFHAQDIGEHGLIGHFGSDEAGLEERVQRICQTSGAVGENIDFGNWKPEDIVCNLLIDDGMYARGQRLNIMKKDHRYVGGAVCAHKDFQFVCVLIFAESVNEDFDCSSDLTLNLEEVKDLKIVGEFSSCLNESSQVVDNQGDDFGEVGVRYEKSGKGAGLVVVETKEEEEISETSAFVKPDHTVAVDEEESVSFSVSKTEVEIKPLPISKPPLVPRPKAKNDDFLLSNFDRSELSKDAIVEIKELFDLYDTSGSGFLDSHALKAMKDQLSDCSNSEVIQVLCNIEPEGVQMNFDNFVDLVAEKLGLSEHRSQSLQKNPQVSTLGKKIFNPALYMRPEFTKEDILEIKAAFDMFDTDNTGTINPNDLKNTLKTQGYEHKSATVFKMISNLQVENMEKINFGEFLDLMASEGVDYNSAEEIRKLFSIFDVENTGFIELTTLKKIAKELGDALDEQEIIELFTKSDRDRDGRVSFQDFYNTMNKQIF